MILGVLLGINTESEHSMRFNGYSTTILSGVFIVWVVLTLTSFLLLKKHSRFILSFDQIVELVFKFEPTIDPALLTMICLIRDL